MNPSWFNQSNVQNNLNLEKIVQTNLKVLGCKLSNYLSIYIVMVDIALNGKVVFV
jgi:hypothetical protein